MRVKLLVPHTLGDRWLPARTELEWLLPVTTFMEGLDEEARKAIAAERFRINARYVRGRLLDDPPIERPFDTPPIPLLRSGGPPR